VAKFLYEQVIIRFGCPIKIVTDQGGQGGHFIHEAIYELMNNHTIIHKKSTMYYPQANGQT